MPRNRWLRTLRELLHIAAGVVLTGIVANLAAWSVPNAANAIWWVALGAVGVVVYMGLAPLLAAWEADRVRGADDASDD